MSAASFAGVADDDIMNPNRERKPSKGILKNSSSFDTVEPHQRKEMKWDEMNILATFHPLDKDYGHMKVDEPPTPYSGSIILDDDDDDDDHELCDSTSGKRRSGSFDHSAVLKLDADTLASRLEGGHEPTVMHGRLSQSSEDDLDDDEHKERNAEFEQKRRMHYNEFHAMRLAKHLMEQEDEEEENEDSTAHDILATQPTEERVITDTIDPPFDNLMAPNLSHNTGCSN